jgi:hypothetical protein
VAVSADGNTAMVGEAGGAWIFTRSGSTWTVPRAKIASGHGLPR